MWTYCRTKAVQITNILIVKLKHYSEACDGNIEWKTQRGSARHVNATVPRHSIVGIL